MERSPLYANWKTAIDQESGEYGERRLNHPGEAAPFHRVLAGPRGDPSAIHAAIARRQQTGKRDARHILKLLALLDEFDIPHALG